MSFDGVENVNDSQEAIDFGFLLIYVSFVLFLISFTEESASHPTSEAECPQ